MRMSIVDVRTEALHWKKDSLSKLQQADALVSEFKGNFNKLCSGLKAVFRDVNQGAARLQKQFDKHLESDEEDSDYDRDYSTMSALEEVPDGVETADDVKLQAGESLDGLLSKLEEILKAVREVKP